MVLTETSCKIPDEIFKESCRDALLDFPGKDLVKNCEIKIEILDGALNMNASAELQSKIISE